MRLVHLTDPHMSSLANESLFSLRGKRWSGYLSWKKNRSKKYLPGVLESMVKAIKSEQADQIFLTGDLVHIGLDKEIAEASDWLASLGSAQQVMLVPGNHDIYADDSSASVNNLWSNYLFHNDQAEKPWPADEFPVLRKRGKLSFIGVSSACVTPVFMASGKVGGQQLSRLEALLRQAHVEGQLVCLLIHHPPLPDMTNWRKALADAAPLQDVLALLPPPLIFHGHLHHNREILWGDSRIYCTSAASSVSDASYRVIDIEEGNESWKLNMSLKSISIESGDKAEFRVVDEQSWELPKN